MISTVAAGRAGQAAIGPRLNIAATSHRVRDQMEATFVHHSQSNEGKRTAKCTAVKVLESIALSYYRSLLESRKPKVTSHIHVSLERQLNIRLDGDLAIKILANEQSCGLTRPYQLINYTCMCCDCVML